MHTPTQTPACKALLLTVVLLACSFFAHARIWRVNGNPGVSSDFNQITNAISSASVQAGDTLIVEPLLSGGAYAGFNLQKRLIMYGSGYRLDQNDSTQYVLKNTRVSNYCSFSAGSEHSLFSGFEVSPNEYNNGAIIAINTDHITIEKCYLQRDGYNSGMAIYVNEAGQNTIIRKCYFTGSLNGILPFIRIGASDNIITNNIFNGIGSNAISFTGSSATAVISNNIFKAKLDPLYNSFLYNNIFLVPNQTAGIDNTFYNNIFAGNPVVSGLGNQFDVDMNSVFADDTHAEKQYRLKAGSPAMGAANDGGDCGAFGGADPYVLSGMPPIPSIFYFDADPVISPATNIMSVRVKAKVNR